MAKDPYSALGVSKSATQDEIKAAYRNLAKKHHPDLNAGNKEAERRFKEINDAYNVIGDEKKREEFDRFGEAPFGGAEEQGPFSQRGAKYASGFSYGGGPDTQGFESIFETLFGGGRQRPGRAPEQVYRMVVSFKDAILGATREVTLPNGERFSVKIPPGVNSGTRLRLGGQRKEPDIYIELEVQTSTVFKRSGNDLELELPVSLSEAILGGEAQVPVIDGEVTLTIPPGVTTGSRLRLRGKGVAAHGQKSAGDQFMIVKIVMPAKIDRELHESIETWSQHHSYDPRKSLWEAIEKERRRVA
jgi:DnaJ-class molecular chaperone